MAISVLDSISFKMATHMATFIAYFTFSDFWRLLKATLLILFSFSHQTNTTKISLKSLERSRNQRNVGKKIMMFLILVREREMIASLSGRGWGRERRMQGNIVLRHEKSSMIFFLFLNFIFSKNR